MQVAATLDGEVKCTASFAARTQVKIAAEAVSGRGINGAADAVEGGENLKAREIDKQPCFLEAKATRKMTAATDVSGSPRTC
jgi:hypothetical protein